MDPFILRVGDGTYYRQSQLVENGPSVSLLDRGLPDSLCAQGGDIKPVPIINKFVKGADDCGSICLSNDFSTTFLYVAKAVDPLSYTLSTDLITLPPETKSIVVLAAKDHDMEYAIHLVHQLLHRRRVLHDTALIKKLNTQELALDRYADILEQEERGQKVSIFLHYIKLTRGTLARLWLIAEAGMLHAIEMKEATIDWTVKHCLVDLYEFCNKMNVLTSASGSHIHGNLVSGRRCFDVIDYLVTDSCKDVNIGPCRSLRIEVEKKGRPLYLCNSRDINVMQDIETARRTSAAATTFIRIGVFSSLHLVLHNDNRVNMMPFLRSIVKTHAADGLPEVTVTYKPRKKPPILITRLSLQHGAMLPEQKGVCEQVAKSMALIDKHTRHALDIKGDFSEADYLLFATPPEPPPIFHSLGCSSFSGDISTGYADLLSTNNHEFLATTLHCWVRNVHVESYIELTQLESWLNARYALDKAVKGKIMDGVLRTVKGFPTDLYTIIHAYIGFEIPSQQYSPWLDRHVGPMPLHKQIAVIPALPTLRTESRARRAKAKVVIDLSAESERKIPEGKQAENEHVESEPQSTPPERYDGDGEYDPSFPTDTHYENFRNRKYKRNHKRKRVDMSR
jgi:hypothetical protein